MNSRGSVFLEVAIILPVVIIFISVFIYVFLQSVTFETVDKNSSYIDEIAEVDSIKRKSRIFDVKK